jgi:regulator of protease activity HflC (stomatin/prohibitin superfamily)
VGIIVFSVSWKSLEPTEWGLAYNTATGTVYTNYVYESGRYFLGPAVQFIRFPKTFVNIEFSQREGANDGPIQTRTKNGVPITIYASFQYKIQRDNITALYNKYGTNYEGPMIRVARNYILQAAGDYDSMDFWLKRSQIGSEMLSFLRNNLGPNMFVEIRMMQLLNIELPPKYEQSIINTQVQQQQLLTQEYLQQVTRIQLQIKQLYASAQYNCTIIGAKAESQAIQVVNRAAGNAFQYTQSTQATVFRNFAQSLGMNSTQFIEYLKIRNLRDKTSGKGIKIGLEKPLV